MSFAENLQFLRKRDKVTQEELADKLGVSRQSVSKWETGEAYPEMENLLGLCDLFGVTLDGLMREDLTQGDKRSDGERSDGEQEVKDEYVTNVNRFSLAIAAGVMLILFGVSVCVALCGIAEMLGSAAKTVQLMSGVVVILFVAVAVFLFVFYGMQYDGFCKAHPVVSTVYEDDRIKTFSKRFAVAMACLVSGILLDVVFLVLFSSFIDSGIIAAANKDAAYCYVTAAFLAALSGIVFGLVYFGIQRSKYYVEEYNKQNADKFGSTASKFANAIGGVVMLTATAVFLLIGFVWNLWHPGWIVFPLGGIVCAIINTVANIKKK